MHRPATMTGALVRLARRVPLPFFGLGVLGLAVILRLPLLFVEILEGDEAIWWVGAKKLLAGLLPYAGFIENKPPGIFVLYAIPQVLGTENLLGVHVLAILWLAATAIVVGAIAARLSEGDQAPIARWLAATVFLALSAVGPPERTYILYTETAGLLPLALSMWLLSNPLLSARTLLMAGIMAAGATLFRQTFLAALPILALAPLARGREGFVRRALTFCAGVGVVWGLFAVYLFATGTFGQAMYWIFSVNFTHSELAPTLSMQRRNFSRDMAGMLIVSAPAWWLVARQLRAGQWQEPKQRLVTGWAALALVMLATCAVSGRWLAHYLLQSFVPLAVVVAMAAVRPRSERGPSAWVPVAAIGLALLVGGYRSFEGTGRAMRREFKAARRGLEVTGRQVAELTAGQGEDSLYLWGIDHTLYYRARRVPPTRFILPYTSISGYLFANEWADPELDPTTLIIPDHWDVFMKELRANPPAVFFDEAALGAWFRKHQLTRYPELQAFVRENYRPLDPHDPVVYLREDLKVP